MLAQRGPLAAPSPSVRRAAVLLLVAFAIASVGAFGLPREALGWSAGAFNADSEQELLARTNQARASAGLRALRWDATLGSIARSRSQDMIERDYFSHTIAGSGRHVWDVMDDRGYCYALAGENIGWNQHWADDQATAEIHTSFMGSSGHRANIMGDAWDVVGIGAFKGADGKAMWTVVFADQCGAVAAATSSTAPKPIVTVPATPNPTARPAGRVTSVTASVARTVTWRWTATTPTSPTPTRKACSFDVFYRDNLGPWKLLRTRTTARAISLALRTPGHTYSLRVRARDCSGNAGTWSAPRFLTVS
jgi:uncharacterized protein YkwD